MKCKLLQRALSLQITSLLCYIHVNALILANELKKIKCNRDRAGRTQSSHSRHNPQIIWDMRNRLVNSLADDFLLLFGYFWLFFSVIFRCAVILSFSQAVIMLSSHPTPKENSHLLSPSPTLPTKGNPVSFRELNKIQVFQYIFHIPWQHPCIWNKVLN